MNVSLMGERVVACGHFVVSLMVQRLHFLVVCELGPPWFNYWFSFTLAYSRISLEYSSLFIIVIGLIFMFSL